MTKFYLRRQVLASNVSMPITQEQYDDLTDAITTQWEALYLEQKFDFVVENYLEFEETILRCGLHHMILERGARSHNDDASLFNRRIMNFLTTYKTYVDTFPQHFNRIFARDPEITSQAESSFSEEYDARIGYWMLPKIRNFVQHQGFPVHSYTYSSTWISSENEAGAKHRNRYTIDLFLTIEELSKGGFKPEVIARLNTMREKIDLKFLIRDFMEGFSAAHVRNRALLKDKLEWAAAYIRSAESDYLAISGDRSRVALAAMSTIKTCRPVYLQMSAEGQRTYLVEKNIQLVNLAQRYISNEIFSDKVENETCD